MKMGGVNRFDQLNRIARTFNVHGDLTRLIGPQVIDRRQVIKVINLTSA